MSEKIFKYHMVLKDIYDHMGLEWFTYRQYHKVKTINDNENHIRSMMHYIIDPGTRHFDYGYKSNHFIACKTWKQLTNEYNLYEHVDANGRRSKYWRVTHLGLLELFRVCGALIVKQEHVPVLAKIHLNGGVLDSTYGIESQ